MTENNELPLKSRNALMKQIEQPFILTLLKYITVMVAVISLIWAVS